MSGEELKKRLKAVGITQREIARRLNVIPETVVQALKAKDIKTGFIEELCRVLEKDISFFYPCEPDGKMEGDFEKLRKKNKTKEEKEYEANEKRENGWIKEIDVIERMQDVAREKSIELPQDIEHRHLFVNDVLFLINRFPNLSAEWIITGTGQMILPVVGNSARDERNVPSWMYKELQEERDKWRDKCKELEAERDDLIDRLSKHEAVEKRKLV